MVSWKWQEMREQRRAGSSVKFRGCRDVSPVLGDGCWKVMSGISLCELKDPLGPLGSAGQTVVFGSVKDKGSSWSVDEPSFGTRAVLPFVYLPGFRFWTFLLSHQFHSFTSQIASFAGWDLSRTFRQTRKRYVGTLLRDCLLWFSAFSLRKQWREAGELLSLWYPSIHLSVLPSVEDTSNYIVLAARNTTLAPSVRSLLQALLCRCGLDVWFLVTSLVWHCRSVRGIWNGGKKQKTKTFGMPSVQFTPCVITLLSTGGGEQKTFLPPQITKTITSCPWLLNLLSLPLVLSPSCMD